jgi:sugar lactone lactonase YvrE
MYFADTAVGEISVFDFDAATGSATNRRSFRRFSGIRDGRPDGLCVDASGTVWVAMYGGGVVRGFTPEGRDSASVLVPVRAVTSCAYGGEGLTTMFVTTAGREPGLRFQDGGGRLFGALLPQPGRKPTLFAG